MRTYTFLSFILLLTILILGSCMSSVNLQVMKPADITLPEHIKKVAVVNRTKPSKENKAMNIIEGVFTGEGIGADREGSEDCLFGLRESLTRTPRFQVVQPPGLDLRGTGTAIFPTPMSWEEVEKICRDNSTDAVIALEAFDSDSRVTFDTAPVKTKDSKGVEITSTEHRGHMRMDITSGWRIYDPSTKRIVDEFKAVDDLGFDSKGVSQEEAGKKLPHKREAIKKTGFHAGKLYGNRISPSWIRVSRAYYTKGNDAFKAAKKKVKYNDWTGAAELWKKESLNADPKIAGKASYNMALACEVEGNLDLALEWANKSYKNFHNSKAGGYIRILNGRIRDSERLKEQMK